MKASIEVSDEKLRKTVKSVVEDLFSMKYDDKDFEGIKKKVMKVIIKNINENIYDIVKEAVEEYFR